MFFIFIPNYGIYFEKYIFATYDNAMATLEYKNRTETFRVKRICKLGICGGGNDMLLVVMSHQSKHIMTGLATDIQRMTTRRLLRLLISSLFILITCGLCLGVYKREWEPIFSIFLWILTEKKPKHLKT